MAPYAVSFRRSAEKDLRRLDDALQSRILDAVEGLGSNPRPFGFRKLQGRRREDVFRIRVGDYRVVYSVDDEAKVVTVERVRHRREVYRG
jgi:mRNA interferase RelE/StbE